MRKISSNYERNAMYSVYFLITIVQREYSEEYISFFKKSGVSSIFSALCRGTAGQKILDYLGIEKTEKTVLYAMVSGKLCKKLLHDLVYKMDIDAPGNGIALTVPVGSLGGESCMKYFTEGQEIIISEVNQMDEVREAAYALIIAITDKGSVDRVMDAAREANAGGGTVVHAKGTCSESTSKFFGVSIADEKEMIYIVAKKKDKNNIMKAIMSKAGLRTDAHTAVFSLPVSNVVGLRSVTEEDEEE